MIVLMKYHLYNISSRIFLFFLNRFIYVQNKGVDLVLFLSTRRAKYLTMLDEQEGSKFNWIIKRIKKDHIE